MDLLDGRDRLLRHPRDRPTIFTGQADALAGDGMRYAELDLEPMHWEWRRQASKVRLRLEPVEDPAGAWTAVAPLTEDPRYEVWQEDTDAQGRLQIRDGPDPDDPGRREEDPTCLGCAVSAVADSCGQSARRPGKRVWSRRTPEQT